MGSDICVISNLIRTYRALIRLRCEKVRFQSVGFPYKFGQVCRLYVRESLRKDNFVLMASSLRGRKPKTLSASAMGLGDKMYRVERQSYDVTEHFASTSVCRQVSRNIVYVERAMR